MKFLAFNGSYRVFGWIPAGDLGAHDADWEHVTARLSPDGSQLLGVYYSAHRQALACVGHAAELGRDHAAAHAAAGALFLGWTGVSGVLAVSFAC